MLRIQPTSLLLLPLLGTCALLSGCGGSEPSAKTMQEKIDWSSRSQNYTPESSFSCKDFSPADFIEQFTLGLDVLANNCEKQNEQFRKKGQTPCDYNLCKQDLKPGGQTPPTLDFKIVINLPLGSGGNGRPTTSYSSSSSGGFGGFGSSGSSTGSIQISLGLNFTLGKKPDEYTCSNPYSLDIQKEIVKAALDFAKACKT